MSNINKGIHPFKSFNPLSVPGPLYEDLKTPAASLGKGSSAPTVKVFVGSIELPAFAPSGPTEDGQFSVHLPHDFKAGSTPTFHVHWSHTEAAPTGSVVWGVEVTGAKGYNAGGFVAPVAVSTTSAAAAQVDGDPPHTITNDDDMPLPAALVAILEPDTELLCRVFRDTGDPADDFGFDAFFIEIDLHYEIGQIATEERNRPFPSAGFSP